MAQLVAKEGQLQLITPFMDSGKLEKLLSVLKDSAIASLSNSGDILPWTSQIGLDKRD